MHTVNTTAGSIRQLPSGKWQATLVLGEGRGAPKKTKSFPTRRDASAWLAAVKAEGVPSGPASTQTVAQSFDAYLDARVLAPNTVATFTHTRQHVVAAGLGDVKLAKLKPSALHQFTAHLAREGLAAASVNLYARHLATVLKFAHADGGLGFNPSAVTVSVRRAEVPALTIDQVKKLYEAAPDELAPVILFGAFAGLRASEACAVTVADVDFLHGTLTVDKAVDKWGEFVKTKTARSMRRVPLGPEVLELLARACEGKEREDTIATNAHGGIVTTGTLTKAFTRIAADAGVDTTFHALRKFYATTLLARGVNPTAAAQFWATPSP
jgi:integrase